MGGTDRRGRQRIWIAIGCLTVVAAAGIGLLVSRPAEPEATFCAGVGLIAPGTHPSAEEAFAAWLADNPAQPPRSAWKRAPDTVGSTTKMRSVEYATDDSDRYWSVSVGAGVRDEDGSVTGLDRWRATGACVRSTP
jgi:hypothetical protein